MKKLLFVFILIVPISILAQIKVDTINKDIIYSEVFELEKSKKEIHQNVFEWIALSYKDANDVIKLNTEDKIITKGLFSMVINSSGYEVPLNIKFIMEISFKDSKYKIDMHSFKIVGDYPDVLLFDHYSNMKFESYIKALEKGRNLAVEKYLIKYYDKILTDKVKLKKSYEDQIKLSGQIIDYSEINIKYIVKSVYEYVLKQNSSGW